MADIVIDRSDAQIKTGIEKASDLQSSASEIDVSVMMHTHMNNFIIEGETDMALAFNRAGRYIKDNRSTIKNSTLVTPSGLLSIETPLKLYKGVNYKCEGYGTSSNGGTEFICNFPQLVIDNPPTDMYKDHYDVVFDYTPMMYNVELIATANIEGFRLNGNNKDVYGLYLNEMYYTRTESIMVKQCNKSPLTLVYCQFNEMLFTALNNNKDKARILCSATTELRGLDIEGYEGATSEILDIIHDISYKTGIKISNLHYEDSTAEGTPAGTFIRIGQRGVIFDTCYIFERGVNDRNILFMDSSTSYVFDSVTISSTAPTNSRLLGVNTSGSTINIKVEEAAYSNLELVTNMNIDTSLVTTTLPTIRTGVSEFLRGFIIKSRDNLSKVLSFPSDERMDFGDGTRKISFSSTDLIIENTNVGGVSYLKSGGRMNLISKEDVRSQSKNLRILKQNGSSGDWQEGLLILSNYRLWVDSTGILRIKDGAPAFDTDGSIVGSQA